MSSLLFGNQAPDRAPHRRDYMLLVQVAGLLATAWLIWSISLVPRLNRESLADVLAQTLAFTLLACLASAAIALSLYLLIARSFRDDAIQMAMRTSSTAVWFAAATILLAQLSPATFPAALVLVVSTTRLLYSQWRLVHTVEPFAVVVPSQHPYLDPPPSPRFRELIPGLTASFAVQASVLVFPLGYPLLAAALLAMSVAMVTLCALRSGAARVEAPNSLPRSILGFLLTLVLAAGLTVGGVAEGFGAGSHWHSRLQLRPNPFDSARALLHKLFEETGEEKIQEPATTLYLPAAGNVEITDNSFPGVILLPEVKPEQPVLIAPSTSWRNISPEVTVKKKLRIQFSGVYWMYRPPFDRPPRTSHVQQGNPLKLSFRTTDHAPMSMEAYQKFDRPIEATCCSAIQIEISNADRYAGTIALELQLIDTQSTGQPMLSLGSLTPTSRPRTAALPASEILEFVVPSSVNFHRFDGIKVIFHRDSLRSENSARISIDRFLLLPR